MKYGGELSSRPLIDPLLRRTPSSQRFQECCSEVNCDGWDIIMGRRGLIVGDSAGLVFPGG